jgi:hypothetical protein
MEERRMREDEVVAKVIRKLIELAPDALERALRESGALSEMRRIEAGAEV